jgi:hypothetical protein
VSRAASCAFALDLALEHQHGVTHRDPDRPHASVLVESPHLREAEHSAVEPQRALGVGDAQGHVMDACGVVHAPIMPQAGPPSR